LPPFFLLFPFSHFTFQHGYRVYRGSLNVSIFTLIFNLQFFNLQSLCSMLSGAAMALKNFMGIPIYLSQFLDIYLGLRGKYVFLKKSKFINLYWRINGKR
jgi:hypothetical protein